MGYITIFTERISIHALREEGDGARTSGSAMKKAFLSTPSARRATVMGYITIFTERISIHALREEGDHRHASGCFVHKVISIHALREEGDGSIMTLETYRENFYPRPPRGGRLRVALCIDFFI